jgi:transcriptional regulator with XRE-family HTH domain
MATIGERIRELRNGWMSQQELASAAGVSVELVRKLEQGKRNTATVASLEKIANALDSDVAYLFSKAKPPPTTEPNSGIVAIRRALTSIEDLVGFDGSAGEAVSLAEAERTVSYLWGARWSGRYELLTSLMANAIGQLRATYRDASTADKSRAARLLARTYTVASALLATVGQTDLAFIANKEALAVAKTGDDELLYATLHMYAADYLKAQSRYSDAVDVCVKVAEGISPRGDVSNAQLAAYGLLLATATMNAGRNSEDESYVDLLAESQRIAGRIGYECHDHDTTFGPAKISMIATTLAVERENYSETLKAAGRIPSDADLPTASRVALLSNVALAHLRLGRDQRSLDAALLAESVSAECVKYQSRPDYSTDFRQIAGELLAREKRKSARLRDFAARVGAVRLT